MRYQLLEGSVVYILTEEQYTQLTALGMLRPVPNSVGIFMLPEPDEITSDPGSVLATGPVALLSVCRTLMDVVANNA